MSWAVGYDSNWQRDIGYGVPALCDHPGCNTEINRGLSYVCGGEPYGGEYGCGLYFCPDHHSIADLQRCERCQNEQEPFEAKPDLPEWTNHKMTHPSWIEWKVEQGIERDLASCSHEYEWLGGGSSPDGLTEPNHVCAHCGSENLEDM